MDLRFDEAVAASPEGVLAAVADLGTYPAWLGLVEVAEPDGVHGDDPGPAWRIELAGRVGPLVRRKRVRMVRTEHLVDAAGGRVRFERMERDGGSHGTWTLEVDVQGSAETTRVTVHLAYRGRAWLPGVDALLRREAAGAGRRLQQVVARAGGA